MKKMPLEGLEEEGLPKVPDLRLVQLKFLLTVEESQGIDRDSTWTKLIQAITDDGRSSCRASLVYVQ